MSAESEAALYVALCFFIVGNPKMYEITQKVLGSCVDMIDENGCPTQMGVGIHTLVFLLLVMVPTVGKKNNSNSK